MIPLAVYLTIGILLFMVVTGLIFTKQFEEMAKVQEAESPVHAMRGWPSILCLGAYIILAWPVFIWRNRITADDRERIARKIKEE